MGGLVSTTFFFVFPEAPYHFDIAEPCLTDGSEMAQILIEGLDDQVVARLKSRAESHGRSLEGEVRSMLESAAGFTAWVRPIQGGMRHSSSNSLRGASDS
jgi:hypothetical protein